jgi:hypothetical protein
VQALDVRARIAQEGILWGAGPYLPLDPASHAKVLLAGNGFNALKKLDASGVQTACCWF